MATLVLRVGGSGGGAPAGPGAGRAAARAPAEAIGVALRATLGDVVEAVEAAVGAQLASVHPTLPFSVRMALEAVEAPGFSRLDAVRAVHATVFEAYKCA